MAQHHQTYTAAPNTDGISELDVQCWQHEAYELEVFASNTFEYERLTLAPLRAMLFRKMEKGTYDRRKALDYMTGEPLRVAARMYIKEATLGRASMREMFPPACRRIVAATMLDYIEERYRWEVANAEKVTA